VIFCSQVNGIKEIPRLKMTSTIKRLVHVIDHQKRKN